MHKKNKEKIFYSLVVLLLTAIIVLLSMILKKEIIEKKESVASQTIRIQPSACSTEKGIVNLTFITDSRYVPPTITAISSAIKNKCDTSIYNFYIITENITPADANALYRLKELAPETVNIILIPQKEPDLPYENMQRFLQYKVGMHKIYLSEILKNLDKVIYMDGDVLVLKDLRALYDIDVDGVYAAVAKDGIFYRFPKEMAEIGLDKRGFYFNSGVMLQNLKQQREDNIVSKLVDYVKTHEDFFGDQDVLNIVWGNKLKLMSYRYNCISTFFEADDLNFLSEYFGEKLPEKTFNIYENATVLHYAGDKPWQENYQPEYLKELWFRYYNQIKDY
ncbi:MAG: glycosyltransferase family 8 protein [Acetobacter sp.]|nr:glycosyltransferase family 8 protein [Acetobacter sp.]